jgi:hypothetical protein
MKNEELGLSSSFLIRNSKFFISDLLKASC